ncbi:unnamed protein product [Nezara viridula]|uniref:Uncharacterized protein n=1 Tax=Nezara viridula TaxID=85310 RepID=A0A9P0HN41_NEZVI|nr:unnamed protein product [Nezara viridula]
MPQRLMFNQAVSWTARRSGGCGDVTGQSTNVMESERERDNRWLSLADERRTNGNEHGNFSFSFISAGPTDWSLAPPITFGPTYRLQFSHKKPVGNRGHIVFLPRFLAKGPAPKYPVYRGWTQGPADIGKKKDDEGGHEWRYSQDQDINILALATSYIPVINRTSGRPTSKKTTEYHGDRTQNGKMRVGSGVPD